MLGLENMPPSRQVEIIVISAIVISSLYLFYRLGLFKKS